VISAGGTGRASFTIASPTWVRLAVSAERLAAERSRCSRKIRASRTPLETALGGRLPAWSCRRKAVSGGRAREAGPAAEGVGTGQQTEGGGVGGEIVGLGGPRARIGAAESGEPGRASGIGLGAFEEKAEMFEVLERGVGG
jgi:hypothetical protein